VAQQVTRPPSLVDQADAAEFDAMMGLSAPAGAAPPQDFENDTDAAGWFDAFLRQSEGAWDKAAPKVGFVEGFGSGFMGTAGTLARSARLPEEVIVNTLGAFGLDEGDQKAVRAVLGTMGQFAIPRMIAAQGEKAQGVAAEIGEGEKTFMGKVGQAAGSATAIAPAALTGGALGAGVVGGMVASGTAGAALTSESLLERGEQLDASPGQKLGAMAAGVPIGAVEAFGVGKHLGALGKLFAGGSPAIRQRLATDLLQVALRAGAEEGLEEVVQGLGEEAVEQWILEDPEKNGRALMDWLNSAAEVALDEGLPAGIVGMVMGGMVRSGELARQPKQAKAAEADPLQTAPLNDFGALVEDSERQSSAEWGPLREAMEAQNETPLRFVKPAGEEQTRAAALAKKLGLDVGFVEAMPADVKAGQDALEVSEVASAPAEVNVRAETLPNVTVAEMPTDSTMFGEVERETKGAVRGDIVTPTVTQPNLLDIQSDDVKGQRSMLDQPEVAAGIKSKQAAKPKAKASGFAEIKRQASSGELGFRAWVRAMGGLNIAATPDLKGELRGIKEGDTDKLFGLGPLVRGEKSNVGVSPDTLLEAAMERGYLPQGSGIREVFNLLDSDYTPEKAQRDADRAMALEEVRDEEEFQSRLEDAGLPPTTTREQYFASLGQEPEPAATVGDDIPFAASAATPLRFPAAYMGGRVAIDARAATPKRLLFHEGLHHLAANNAPGFARLLAAMTDMKPAQIAAARRAYATAFGEGAPVDAALDEEAAAVFSEDLAGVLEKAFDDPAKLTRVLSDRSIFEVVRDWIARTARTFGGSMRTTLERRLAAVDAADDAEVKLALLWKDTLDAINSEMRAGEAEAAVRDDAKFAAAYHGTPFDFDKFQMSKVGTGEGAQAYGHGLYFAGNREVAEFYRKKLSAPARTLQQRARDVYSEFDSPDDAIEAFTTAPGFTDSERALLKMLGEEGWWGFDYPHQAISVALGPAEDLDVLDLTPEQRAIIDTLKSERRGKLYEVELAPAEDEFLLWDERASDQSEKVKAALSRVFGEMGFSGTGELIYKELRSGAGERYGGGSDRAASAALHAAGVRGIKYLDGSSRSKGDGNYNYVIFDESDVTIKSKFAVDPARVQAAAAQARAEGESTEIGSQPSRIADTSTDPDQRAQRRGVREVRAEGEQVVTLEEQQRRADAVDADEVLAKAQSGEPLQAHEQIALDRVRVEHATSAMRSGSEADIMRAIDTEWTYQDVRRDTARALGAIRDPLRAQSPAETVAEFAFELSPDLRIRIERATKRLAEAQEKGRPQRVAIEQAAIQRLKGIEAKRVQKALAALKAQGFDPALLTADYLNDPDIAARIARTVYTAKSPKFDWYKEFILSGMLSAPGTQVVNITGNTMNTGVEQVATRLATAMANTVVRDANSPSWGETAAFFKAFNTASMKAGQVFMRSMRTDMPVFEIELRRQGVVIPETPGAKLDVGRAAIPGVAGRIVRGPSLTMMRATDEAARAFSYVTEGTALAFRAAKKEGVTGDALAARTLEILNGPYRVDVHGAALKVADKMTFRDKDDPITQHILNMRRMADTMIGSEKHGFFPAGTMVMPFVSFGAKSLRTAVGLPARPFVTAWYGIERLVNQGPYVGDTPRAVQDVGRSMVSLLLMYGLLALVEDRDERGLPYITGTSRPYEWDDTTVPPMSVRVGDTWYSYERLDPASTSIALIVDMLHEADANGIGAAFVKGAHTLANVVSDKSYLATLGEIFRAVSEPDAETWQARGARIASRALVLPMVPNLIRSTATATDEFKRVTPARKEQEDDGMWDVLASEVDYRILPTGARAPAIKYDIWGRPMLRPGRSFVERLLSPVKTTGNVEDATDLDVLIWRYNQRFERGEITDAEARRFVPRPADFSYSRRDGSKGYWTDAEYDQLQREAGQGALERLRGRKLNFESPDWEDIERIRKAISDARSRTKREILRDMDPVEVTRN
jgi:hypothetical protein